MKHGIIRNVICRSFLMGALLALFAVPAMCAEYVSVTKDGVNVRSGPGTNNQILFELPARYPLKVISHDGKWTKVSDHEGDTGWIFSGLVDSTEHVIVKVDEGNLRSKPSTKGDKLGTVSKGVILKVMARRGDWIQVSHPQVTGWIYGKLVWP